MPEQQWQPLFKRDWLDDERPTYDFTQWRDTIVPRRFLDKPRWRCPNGHVSRMYLKSEQYGGDVCLACYQFVRLVLRDEDLVETAS